MKPNTFVARDSFRMMFPHATYNKSPIYDFMMGGKTYKCISTISDNFARHAAYDADVYAMFLFADDAKTLLRAWLIPKAVAHWSIPVHKLTDDSKWEEYELDLSESATGGTYSRLANRYASMKCAHQCTS